MATPAPRPTVIRKENLNSLRVGVNMSYINSQENRITIAEADHTVVGVEAGSSGLNPISTVKGHVAQPKIRLRESGASAICGNSPNTKSTIASNPKNTMSNAAIPIAI